MTSEDKQLNSWCGKMMRDDKIPTDQITKHFWTMITVRVAMGRRVA